MVGIEAGSWLRAVLPRQARRLELSHSAPFHMTGVAPTGSKVDVRVVALDEAHEAPAEESGAAGSGWR
jgi:hypothetical protein